MNIHDLAFALIRVDLRFQRTLNRTCVQRIENAHETRIRSTNTWASVYLCKKDVAFSVFLPLQNGK